MLGSAWLFITIVLLVLAVFLKQSPLLMVAILFFLTSGVARTWSRYALRRVDYERHLSDGRVFFGEEITLDLSISNSKFLPLPWLHIKEEVPKGLTFLKGKTSLSSKPERAILSSFLSGTFESGGISLRTRYR